MSNWYTAADLVGLPGMPDTIKGVEEVARMMEWESRPSFDDLIDSIEQSLAILDDQDAEELVLTIWSLGYGIDGHFNPYIEGESQGGEPAVDFGREIISEIAGQDISRRESIEDLFADCVEIFLGLPENLSRVLAHHAKRLADHAVLCHKPERCHG